MERRKFIQISGSLGLMSTIAPACSASRVKNMKEREKTVILFQGDSITDAGRDKKSQLPDQPGSLGRGYAFLSATQLYERYPSLHPQVHNRGISGNKVYQLANRWDIDALELEPDVLSILIGVNDHWHSLRDYEGTPEKYRDDYDELLSRTKEKRPNVQLIICEPFVLLDGTAIEKEKWVPVFDDYRRASKDLANKYQAAYVPYQSIFDEALKRAPASYWAPDGVHPSLAGAQLMANHWVDAFGKLF